MSAQLHSVIPKLPAADLQAAKSFYVEKLKFSTGGRRVSRLSKCSSGMKSNCIFFLYCDLDVNRNDGMCYIRVSGIEELYDSLKKTSGNLYIGKLEPSPWGQKEFSIKDIDANLLTFGERI